MQIFGIEPVTERLLLRVGHDFLEIVRKKERVFSAAEDLVLTKTAPLCGNRAMTPMKSGNITPTAPETWASLKSRIGMMKFRFNRLWKKTSSIICLFQIIYLSKS